MVDLVHDLFWALGATLTALDLPCSLEILPYSAQDTSDRCSRIPGLKSGEPFFGEDSRTFIGVLVPHSKDLPVPPQHPDLLILLRFVVEPFSRPLSQRIRVLDMLSALEPLKDVGSNDPRLRDGWTFSRDHITTVPKSKGFRTLYFPDCSSEQRSRRYHGDPDVG